MIMQSDISTVERELANRRHALASTTTIPNMWEYADAWNKLGADFRAIGYTANAEKCYEKSMRYGAQAGPRNIPLAPFRKAYCENCGDWTDHALNITQDNYTCSQCGNGNEIHVGGLVAALDILEADA